jgi:anti-sigma B factor antagonist
MEIRQTTASGATVLHLSGRLDTETSPRAEPKLLGAAAAGGLLLLDCARLRYCSSAGLRLLLKTLREAEAKGTRLALVEVQELVQEVLVTSGFDKILPIYRNARAALAAMG